MNFQDFRNLQKAYKQVYSSQRLNEFGPGDDGGSLKVGRTFGGAPGTKQNTTVSGSASSGDSNISGSLTKGTFSGQGDNTSQGLDNAIRNYETGSNGNTSTSTITTGVRGTLDANVSGKFGPGQKPPTPVPKPVPKPVLTSVQKPVPTAERPLPKPVLTPVPTAERPVPAPVEREAKNMEAIRLAQKPAPATQTRLRGFM